MILRNNLHACFIPFSKENDESLGGQGKTKNAAKIYAFWKAASRLPQSHQL